MSKHRRPEKSPRLTWPLAIFVLLGLLATASFLIQALPFVLPGVTIDGSINVATKRPSEAEALIAQSFKDLPASVTFSNGLKEARVALKDLPAHLDFKASSEAAFKVGRAANFLVALAEQWQALTRGISVPVVVNKYPERVADFTQKYLTAFETPVVDAKILVQNNSLIAKSAADGALIDAAELLNNLSTALAGHAQSPIEVPLKVMPPTITTAEAQAALAAGQAILARAPLNIEVNGAVPWQVPRETLIQWLDFPINETIRWRIDQTKIADLITTLAPSVSTQPQNAVLGAADNLTKVQKADNDGLMIDITATTAAIYNALLTPELINPQAVAIHQPAEIRADNLDELGLTHLLATGTTDFKGSPASRSHNIGVGAAKFNGILIKPGEIFSFNGRLGEVGAEQGYLPELVIKEDKTIPEYGGGLCQVSTTLFRAAVYSGLKITERRSHSYAVRYYSPTGFDATIYPPYTDLKFENTTPGHLYLQSKIQSTKITFQIFGTSDGRTVKLTGPNVYDQQPDGSLKAVLAQEIFDAAGISMAKKTFYSVYKSPALFPVIRNPLE